MVLDGYTVSTGTTHPSADDRQAHEQIGFHEGWATAAHQLEDLAHSI